ncbi:MAG TPA: SRPBCC domain-containing protein [Chloroflexota bacterium]|jgi:uncharacterized protein YndB with AHSA1/START domain
MNYPFTIEDEIDVDATPEEAWQAISVGPRLDSWFMGRSEIEPRVGGTARIDFDGFAMESTVTEWDPPTRLVYRSSEDPDGAFMEFGWRVEQRAGGGATLHFTHRGCLAGDDSEAEYEALKSGDPMYLRKLAHYLEFFNGQIATRNIAVQGPVVASADQFWSALRRALGLDQGAGVREWDVVHAALDGLGTVDGVVDYLTPAFLGVRSSTALYRFLYAPGGVAMVEHHDFSSSPNGHTSADAWRAWLAKVFE